MLKNHVSRLMSHALQASAVLQTDGFQAVIPALKGGVTANVALQARFVFDVRRGTRDVRSYLSFSKAPNFITRGNNHDHEIER